MPEEMTTPSELQTYSIGRGTNTFYIYRNGSHCLKTVADDTESEIWARRICAMLNAHASIAQRLESVERDYKEALEALKRMGNIPIVMNAGGYWPRLEGVESYKRIFSTPNAIRILGDKQ